MKMQALPADKKGLTLITKIAADVPEGILGDAVRIRQILINLLGNAIKFTEVGTIRLETRLRETLGQGPQNQFTVIDQGIGMTDSQMLNLFRPFTQADSSTTRKYGGTGLGLTICKRLTEILGGDITVSSELNIGSRFSATVRAGSLKGVKLMGEPSNQSSEVQEPKHRRLVCPTSDEKILDGKKILLAEDGPDNQRLIAFILKKAGAEVVFAENGEEAYHAALEAMENGHLFDVILMDIQMPILDGYEATRKLREDGYLGPIISLTANAMEGDREKCIEAGCNSHITKPVNRDQLIQLVAETCDAEPVV